MSTPPFAECLRPLVAVHGTGKAAELCGVTPRTIQLWLKGAGPPPNKATQTGALALLSRPGPKK